MVDQSRANHQLEDEFDVDYGDIPNDLVDNGD